MLEIQMKLCVTEPNIFEKKFFVPKNEKICQAWAKNSGIFYFLNLLKNLAINFYRVII